MAKRGKASRAANKGSGPNARPEALDKMIEESCDLQDLEDKLLEKHIQPIRDKKAAIKADAKDNYDIPTEAMNARIALRRIERRKDNDEVVLAINELFKATPLGKNIDMIAVAERVAAKKAEAKKEAEKAKEDEADL